MSHNPSNIYGADVHVAEVYDQYEAGLEDIKLLRQLIGRTSPLNILEPFCGTGRILIPLALDGHALSGMDQSAAMLGRARQKIQKLPPDVQERIRLAELDVLPNEWPAGFDLVVLGCNCFYELAAPEEQECCIVQAFRSLKPGGCLFIDNDHMEGELAAAWQDLGVIQPSLSGRCADGAVVESTRETIWSDAPGRLVRFRRRTKIVLPDGDVIEQEAIQQKHPVSKAEVQGWLEKQGFAIEAIYGDYHGGQYTDAAPRAIFWARRPYTPSLEI